jgi:hypothetical protein
MTDAIIGHEANRLAVANYSSLAAGANPRPAFAPALAGSIRLKPSSPLSAKAAR